MKNKLTSVNRNSFESELTCVIKGSSVMNVSAAEEEYTLTQLMHLAKRFHNTKRTYLLVDPLQGKHIPVSPKDCLTMLRTLGAKLKREFPQTKLVVGFAETATAIGAAVAEYMGSDCVYIQTTREEVPEVSKWIEFQEFL